MNEDIKTQTRLQKLAIATVTATAVATSVSWMLLILLAGSLIPRSLLIAAVFATTLAFCAYRAVRAGETWVLLAATFFAVAPPAVGNAPAEFRYLGFLAVGYAVGAMLLIASTKTRRRIG